MAAQAGGTLDQFKEQLGTTEMFYTPQSAIDYSTSENLRKTMEYVRDFSFERGLYGAGMSSADDVGIQLPDGSVLGSESNIKLRFDHSYMNMAQEGKL